MVKIKRKVEMTPEEYAKYMIDKHGVSGYESELIDENIIGGPVRFTQTIELNPVSKKDLADKVFWNGKMIVEVEEEITEDTELDLIERFIVNNKTYYTNPQAMSINTCLGAAPDDIIPTHFYIENDDRELVLIWRDGRLIE